MNGQPRDEAKFRNISAYVMQDDYMFANLTVFETLLLSAHFFLPFSMTTAEKENHVRSIIAELGLVKSTDTIIGNDALRGVSGGERRRASIAVQLLTDPAVLFLDEPTSGLDAFQSQTVMESMKNLAQEGNRLVVAVIHQPRSSIYSMFSKMLILSQGRTMYYGDAADAVSYFERWGFKCPDDYNPSDFLLDLLSLDVRTVESQTATSKRIAFLGDCWEDEVVNRKTETESQDYVSVKMIGAEKSLEKNTKSFQLLLWRCWQDQARNRNMIIGKFANSIVFAFLVGGIYSKDSNNQQSIQDMKGILFFIIVNQTFAAMIPMLGAYPREKFIANRERDGGAYTTSTYAMAKYLTELPFILMPVIVYCCIIHPLAGMNPHTMGAFVGICMLTNCVSVALGLAISAYSSSFEVAGTLGPTFIIIGIMFGGFYISVNSVPIVLNGITYLSVFRWAYEALCINEFRGRTYTCNTSPNLCLLTGEEVLQTLSFRSYPIGIPILSLFMLLLGFLGAMYTFLRINRVRYTPLGYTGAKFTKNVDPVVLQQVTHDAQNPIHAASKTETAK
jgi:ATP-binding cassette subfamily G (WHITE) protein 2